MSDLTTNIIVETSDTIEIIDVGVQGPPGPAGEVVATDLISKDPDNRLTRGSDAGLLVPEIGIDPLAYYILSKS